MICVASSWRNDRYVLFVEWLRNNGFAVYDWRDPQHAFHWRELHPNWEEMSIEEYRRVLFSQRASQGFENDKRGLDLSDTCLLLLPCGKSAHLEFGYARGQGKSCAIVLDSLTWKGDHAELMYRLADAVFGEELVEIIRWLEQAGEERHVVTR